MTLEPDRRRRAVRLRLQDPRRPVRRAHQPLPRLPGRDEPRQARAQHAHPRQGAHRPAARVRRARRRATPTPSARATSAPSPSSRRPAPATGWPTRDEPITMPSIKLPAPVMAFAIEPAHKGDEDKVFTALRRLQEEDPTIDLHRDPQTGEQIVAGLSQIHVEVIVDRLKSRFGAEVDAQAAARALPGDDPRQRQGPRPPQEADRRPRPVRRLPHRDRAAGRRTDFEFVDAIKGGVIPTASSRRSRRACARRWPHGAVAGYPVKGVRVRLFDGSYHTVDSSEMAFKLAGSMAMKRGAGATRAPVLLEPIMLVTVSVPEDARRRRDRRPQLAPRAPAGHGGGRRHDRGQGRGADGGDAHLRARPALDHRRPGRVHDGVPALRGGPGAPRAEGRRRGARRPRRRCTSA